MAPQAFAKILGGYDRLDGGFTLWAFNVLTGDPVYRLQKEGEGDAAKWSRIDLSGAEGPSGSGCPRADEERQQTEVGIAAPPPADRSSAFHELLSARFRDVCAHVPR